MRESFGVQAWLFEIQQNLAAAFRVSIASLIWDNLYVVENGKINLPEATAFAPSVNAARILEETHRNTSRNRGCSIF